MKTVTINRVQLDNLYLALCKQQDQLIDKNELDGDGVNNLRSWLQKMEEWVDELRGADLEEAIGVGNGP